MSIDTSQRAAPRAGVSISATSHCRSGGTARWSFFVRGLTLDGRDALLTTDEHGRGLYMFAASSGGHRRELIAPDALVLPDSLSRQEANRALMAVVDGLDRRLLAPRQATPMHAAALVP